MRNFITNKYLRTFSTIFLVIFWPLALVGLTQEDPSAIGILCLSLIAAALGTAVRWIWDNPPSNKNKLDVYHRF